MKSLLKQIFFAATTLLPDSHDNGSILMYHSIGDNAAEFTVSAREFEKHLKYFVSRKYRLFKLSDFLTAQKSHTLPSRSAVLTFDDGYADMHSVLFPLLKKYSVPATIFITTGLIGKEFTTSGNVTLPLLSEAQIREMHESGLIEFLPHGKNHIALDKASIEEAREEILSSWTLLSELLGSTPKIYAFARGRYTIKTLDILREEGFSAAVTVAPGLVRAATDTLQLPRNAIGRDTSFEEFIARLGRAGEWYERMKVWR